MSNDFDWVYSEKVKEHFIKPKNVLQKDEDFQEDGKGMVGNIKCGDQMLMLIKVDKGNNTIKDCRWKTFGCASAIASTSVLSEMIIGMSLEKAYHLSPKEVAKELNGLPDNKVHCSVLGDKALRSAIDDYYQRTGKKDKIEKTNAKVVCNCMNVTDQDIEEAVLEGARDWLQLQEKTKIGTVCGGCKEEALVILADYIKKHFEK